MTETQTLVKQMYKDEAGEPLELTEGQDEIFSAIAQNIYPRIHIGCHTRYGKSLVVALAVLSRVTTFPEKWAIIAPTKDKAKIIMDYIIKHIFDNPHTEKAFIPVDGDSGKKLSREQMKALKKDIRRYRNKNRANFKVGTKLDENGRETDLFGEVFVGTAKEALGFGATRVVLDEAALVDDDDFSLVLRMLGDSPDDNTLVKIGNPFRRNHFLKSYHDPKYKKIIIDCYRSLTEGRMTQAVIDENRDYSFFGVLFECRFPSASEIDESGWLNLFNDSIVKKAQRETTQPLGTSLLGVDVARGGRDYNSIVLRKGNWAKVLVKYKSDDLIHISDVVVTHMREHGVDPKNVFVDDTGVGGGVTDYLKSIGIEITPVTLGESLERDDEEKSEILNVRAQVYAGKDGLSNWVKTGGHLVPHKDWAELLDIRYKKNARGKTQLESKELMRKRGVKSPDIADALALTFAKGEKDTYYKENMQRILQGNNQHQHGGIKNRTELIT